MKFKDTIKIMLENGEFEKIIKNSKGKDKKAAKEFYDLIKDNPDLDRVPGITLLMAIHSVSVLRDVICFMEAEPIVKENNKNC